MNKFILGIALCVFAGAGHASEICEGNFSLVHSNGQAATLDLRSSGGSRSKNITGTFYLNGGSFRLSGNCRLRGDSNADINFSVNFTNGWGTQYYEGTAVFDSSGNQVLSGTTQNGKFQWRATSNDGGGGWDPGPQNICEGQFNLRHSNGQNATISLNSSSGWGDNREVSGTMTVRNLVFNLGGFCRKTSRTTAQISFTVYTTNGWGDINYNGVSRKSGSSVTMSGTSHNGTMRWSASRN
jgi:hypothetical protein